MHKKKSGRQGSQMSLQEDELKIDGDMSNTPVQQNARILQGRVSQILRFSEFESGKEITRQSEITIYPHSHRRFRVTLKAPHPKVAPKKHDKKHDKKIAGWLDKTPQQPNDKKIQDGGSGMAVLKGGGGAPSSPRSKSHQPGCQSAPWKPLSKMPLAGTAVSPTKKGMPGGEGGGLNGIPETEESILHSSQSESVIFTPRSKAALDRAKSAPPEIEERNGHDTKGDIASEHLFLGQKEFLVYLENIDHFKNRQVIRVSSYFVQRAHRGGLSICDAEAGDLDGH
jgi:hypothetical protein